MPHPAFDFDGLKTIADKHTKTTVRENSHGKLLFTELGARLLGAFIGDKSSNMLWVPSELDERLGQKNWLMGGERLWIAPERNFYYTEPMTFDGFQVQKALDPGHYRQTGELIFENRFSLADHLKGITVHNCRAKRTFSIIDDPYKSGLPFTGLRIEDHMEAAEPDFVMCGWSIAQVYTCGKDRPGTALFPIKPGAGFVHYFGSLPENRTSILPGYARFRIDADLVGKVAVRPEDIFFDNPCKAVYISPAPDSADWFSVVKRSDGLPRSQSECVDPAKADTTGPKGAIQSYNWGPKGGAGARSFFGEIELQLSKAQTRDGKSISQATHELLFYRASREEIMDLAKKQLNIRELPKIYE